MAGHWNEMISKVLPTPNHSGILQFQVRRQGSKPHGFYNGISHQLEWLGFEHPFPFTPQYLGVSFLGERGYRDNTPLHSILDSFLHLVPFLGGQTSEIFPQPAAHLFTDPKAKPEINHGQGS